MIITAFLVWWLVQQMLFIPVAFGSKHHQADFAGTKFYDW